MKPKQPYGPPMTLGNMREPGERGLGVRRRFQIELFYTDAVKRPVQSCKCRARSRVRRESLTGKQ
jgi:hypothetical protein